MAPAAHVAKALAMAALLGSAACADVRSATSGVVGTSGYSIRLLGQRAFEHRQNFGGTIVGGLSGIDRDPASGLYYLISDDRSYFSPTRFYTARLTIDETGFHDAELLSVVTLLQPDGHPYLPGTADAETIRHDPETGDLWWASEGARKIDRRRGDLLVDPFVRRSTRDGRPAGDVPLPPMFHVSTDARGPRDNLVFEGMTLSTDRRSLWVAMEAPLLQDGPVPSFDAGAWSRFSRFDRDTGNGFGALAAQYAYPIDPIPNRDVWAAWRAQNGVSEILAVDATHLFVLERAFAIGAGWRIRLFEADFSHATDVGNRDSLAAAGGHSPPFTPMTKRLVLDFDLLGIRIDNLEGLCFGPVLLNGHRTLVLVADDNFNPAQTTQLVALELVDTP